MCNKRVPGHISWESRPPVRRADNLTTFMCRLSRTSGSLNLLEPSRACPGLYRYSFILSRNLPGETVENEDHTLIRTASVRAGFGPGTTRIRSTNITQRTATFGQFECYLGKYISETAQSIFGSRLKMCLRNSVLVRIADLPEAQIEMWI